MGKVRDGYVIINLDHQSDNIFLHQTILFQDEIVLNASGKKIGTVSNYIEDVLFVGDIVEQLRKDEIIPAETEKFAFLNQSGIEDFDIYQGTVVYIGTSIICVYVGVLELTEDYTTVNALDQYNEMQYNDLIEAVESNIDNIVLSSRLEIDSDNKCQSPLAESEGKGTMDNLFGNMGFGRLNSQRFKLSMNGIAVSQNNGKYVVYNKDNNEFVDVTNMLFDIKDALFLLPAVEVNVGDTVVHEGKPYYIVDTANEIKAVSYEDCTQTVLIPKSTMFGIKYFTKVFSMFGDNFASNGDLFNNPMMLMALIEGKNTDLTQLMLFSSLNKGELGNNPMALAMLLKGDSSNESLSTIAMMSMFNGGVNPFAPTKTKEVKKPTSKEN